MVELQELLIRARLLLKRASGRFEVFRLINGRNSTKDISRKTRRSLSSILNDTKKMKDYELISEKVQKNEKSGRYSIFEKNPVIRHLPESAFLDTVAGQSKIKKPELKKNNAVRSVGTARIPKSDELMEICNHGGFGLVLVLQVYIQ